MYRLHEAILSSGGRLNTIRRLNPAAWFRRGIGITSALGAVSNWANQSSHGAARDAKQATGSAQPALQPDGTILFDGTGDFLKCDAFTLVQPETVYLRMKQVTWTNVEAFFDGNALNGGQVQQITATPQIQMSAGTGVAANGNLAVDTWGSVCAVFNGASSLLQIDSTTPTAGNAGAGDMGGLTLGARGANNLFSNIQVSEVIIFAAAHDAATRAAVIAYLASVGP